LADSALKPVSVFYLRLFVLETGVRKEQADKQTDEQDL